MLPWKESSSPNSPALKGFTSVYNENIEKKNVFCSFCEEKHRKLSHECFRASYSNSREYSENFSINSQIAKPVRLHCITYTVACGPALTTPSVSQHTHLFCSEQSRNATFRHFHGSFRTTSYSLSSPMTTRAACGWLWICVGRDGLIRRAPCCKDPCWMTGICVPRASRVPGSDTPLPPILSKEVLQRPRGIYGELIHVSIFQAQNFLENTLPYAN